MKPETADYLDKAQHCLAGAKTIAAAGLPDVAAREETVIVTCMLPIFRYDEAPHRYAEVVFDGVRVPAANMLLWEGSGFEIAMPARAGPHPSLR